MLKKNLCNKKLTRKFTHIRKHASTSNTYVLRIIIDCLYENVKDKE